MGFSRFRALVLTCAAAAVFVGCGGGDDSTPPPASSASLSGTAAGGAAIIGNVLIKDSLGATKGGTIESSGRYNVDVSGMTAPFLLKAYGKVGDTTVTYCSAATSADVGGTINITPFTNLILSNLVGQIAENYFASSTNPTSDLISTTAIAAQESALQAKLQPILAQLGIDSAIDLLRSSFNADHSGIDAVMDLVKVDINSTTGIAEIKNAITQAVISTDDVGTDTDDSTEVDSTKITELTTTAVTDLQAITTQMNNFAKLFATIPPNETAITNSGLFDTSDAFMDMGMGFGEFATELSTDEELIGFSFSNIDILLESNTTGTLTAVMNFKNTTLTEQIRMKVIKTAGTWKIQGDQTIADIEINAQAINNVYNGSSISNGLKVWINPFSYNASHASAMIAGALITGPGLGNGVFMEQGVAEGLTVSGYPDSSHIPECSSSTTTQCVTLADVKDGSVYNVKLAYANQTIIADYNLTLPKAPVATSTLSVASFPAITSALVNDTALTIDAYPQIAAGDIIEFNWTLPALLKSDYISASAWGSNTTEYYKLREDLLAAQTRASFTLGDADINASVTTVTNAGIWLSARDVFDREFVFNSWF